MKATKNAQVNHEETQDDIQLRLDQSFKWLIINGSNIGNLFLISVESSYNYDYFCKIGLWITCPLRGVMM